jgi:hypothetical protein
MRAPVRAVILRAIQLAMLEQAKHRKSCTTSPLFYYTYSGG